MAASSEARGSSSNSILGEAGQRPRQGYPLLLASRKVDDAAVQ